MYLDVYMCWFLYEYKGKKSGMLILEGLFLRIDLLLDKV